MLNGCARRALLDTHEAERGPVDQRDCQRSLENAVNHFAIGRELGVSPKDTPEQNLELLRCVWSDRPEGAELRAAVRRAMRAQSLEFSGVNVEHGYSYTSAAVVPDGTPAPVQLDDIRIYEPSTRPGAPLPHAWIDDEHGNRRPIKDLVTPRAVPAHRRRERPGLVRRGPGLAAEAELPLDALRIGHLDGDLYDPRCVWVR